MAIYIFLPTLHQDEAALGNHDGDSKQECPWQAGTFGAHAQVNNTFPIFRYDYFHVLVGFELLSLTS